MKRKQQHKYNIAYIKNGFEISSTMEAKNIMRARSKAFYMIKNDSLVPKKIKDNMLSKDIIVERIYKTKRTD